MGRQRCSISFLASFVTAIALLASGCAQPSSDTAERSPETTDVADDTRAAPSPITAAADAGRDASSYQAATPPKNADAPVIVMLGDSLTAGYGLAAEYALPAQLQRQFPDARFINAGVSGDTSGGGLDRYEWSVKGADADMVVICLGANDYLRGVSPTTMEANIRALIDKARADEIEVVLVGLAPRGDGLESAYTDVYGKLSKEYNLPLYPAILDGVRDAPDLLQSDGLHPTAAGVAFIADKLGAFLKPHVAALTAETP